MSQNGPSSGSNIRKQNKRLARAKVKAPDEGDKKKDAVAGGAKASSAAGSAQAKGAAGSKANRTPQPLKKAKKTPAQARADRKKHVTAIVVTLFAVLMALSMMLPSFSAIFANGNARQSDDQSSSDSSSGSSSSSDGSDDSSTDMSTVAGVDNSYQPVVSSLEDKLASDGSDLATLLGLGNDYLSWGYQVHSIAKTDDETSHANELLEKAEGYYDQYLALNDSSMVRTNRALCQFYAGDTSGAQAALEELTQADSGFGPAWANLGLVYESEGDADKAKDAYGKAAEADPDDEYGAKSFADQRLASIAQSENPSSAGSAGSTGASAGTTSSSGSSSGATGAQGLSDALGTSL